MVKDQEMEEKYQTLPSEKSPGLNLPTHKCVRKKRGKVLTIYFSKLLNLKFVKKPFIFCQIKPKEPSKSNQLNIVKIICIRNKKEKESQEEVMRPVKTHQQRRTNAEKNFNSESTSVNKEEIGATERNRKISVGKRGTDVINSFLPDVLKIKPTETATKKLTPDPSTPFVEKTPNSKLDKKVSTNEHQCPPESNKLPRLAIKNCMLEKLESQMSQRAEIETRPRRITHSASDTACNFIQPATKQKTTKRRSMSDYFDMKTRNEHFKTGEIKQETVTECNNSTFNSLKIANKKMEEDHIPGKQNLKGKMMTLCEKLPHTPLLGRTRMDPKQGDESGKEKQNDNQIKKTYEISCDEQKSTFQKTVTNFPSLKSFKSQALSSKLYDKPDKPNSKLLKQNSQEIQEERNVNKLCCNLKTKSIHLNTEGMDHEQGSLDVNELKTKLSVHKLTPIPSIESDEFDENDPDDARAKIKEELNTNLQTELSTSSQCHINSGKGILKKNSMVENPSEEINVNAVSAKPKEEMTIPQISKGEPLKKDGFSARMVKFDMPSFDSQTSDELPNMIIKNCQSIIQAEKPNITLNELKSHCATQTTSHNTATYVGEFYELEDFRRMASWMMKDRELDLEMYPTLSQLFEMFLNLCPDDQTSFSLMALDENELQTLHRANLRKLKRTLLCLSTINKKRKGTHSNMDTRSRSTRENGDCIKENLLDMLGSSHQDCTEDIDEEKCDKVNETKDKIQAKEERKISTIKRYSSCPVMTIQNLDDNTDQAFAQTFHFKLQDDDLETAHMNTDVETQFDILGKDNT